MLGSAAAILAAIIIMKTGYMPIDPILSAFVAILILRSAWYVTRDSAHILLQGAPKHLNRSEISAELKQDIAGIEDIEHVHIWSLTDGRAMMTVEVTARSGSDHASLRETIKHHLHDKHGVDHVTLEIS